jgi:hypothetical protein
MPFSISCNVALGEPNRRETLRFNKRTYNAAFGESRSRVSPHFDAHWSRRLWFLSFRVSSQHATVRRKNDSPDLVMVEAVVGATGGGAASKDVYDVVQTFQEPLLIEVEGLFGGVRGIVVREPATSQ